MKKQDNFWSWLLIVLGLLLIFIDKMWRVKTGGLMGLAGAFFGIGLGRITRNWYWSREGKAEEYVQRRKEEAIAQKDERNRMLKDCSGRITSQIMLYVDCFLMILFCVFEIFDIWMPYSEYLGYLVFALAVVQLVCNAVVLNQLQKKL